MFKSIEQKNYRLYTYVYEFKRIGMREKAT